jgi:hypothetical protein
MLREFSFLIDIAVARFRFPVKKCVQDETRAGIAVALDTNILPSVASSAMQFSVLSRPSISKAIFFPFRLFFAYPAWSNKTPLTRR